MKKKCNIFFRNLIGVYLQINIPEISGKNPLWRYFSKINIDALVDITRRKKEHKEDDSSGPSTFSDIRKRFGHHRRSIKNRMRKFYNRHTSDASEKCPNTNGDLGSHGASASCSSASDSGGKSSSENNSEKESGAEAEGNFYRKRSRQFLGTIGLLKKSRTSLCFDDFTSRRKLFVTVSNGEEGKKRTFRSFADKVTASILSK